MIPMMSTPVSRVYGLGLDIWVWVGRDHVHAFRAWVLNGGKAYISIGTWEIALIRVGNVVSIQCVYTLPMHLE